MNLLRQGTSRGVLLTIGLLVLLATPLSLPVSAAQPDPASEEAAQDVPIVAMPTPNPRIAAVWDQTDGALLRGETVGPLVWGEQPLAIATEHYRESTTGLREMVYFDKGRLDILHMPDADEASEWYVTSAALVREMMAGEVQFGDEESVQRGKVTIPVVGDLNQPEALTYATLAKLAAIEDPDPQPLLPDVMFELEFGNEPSSTVGTPITALVSARGTIEPDGVTFDDPATAVTVGAYDEATKRNIAAPFVTWSESLPYSDLYLLGHPLSEPLWIDTVVNGEPKQVLFQAFERRILTYTPGNAEGMQVESTDVGIHYRLWRSLAQPANVALVPLASSIPFGEEIVNAATANLVDPHLLAALSLAASEGDPLATLPNGGKGILGLRPDAAIALGVQPDPQVNVTSASGDGTTTVEPTPTPDTTETTETENVADDDDADTAIMPGGIVMAPRWVSDVMADPAHNAAFAAREVARWAPESLDFGTIASDYYSGGQPVADEAARAAFVARVVEIHTQLTEQYPQNILPEMGAADGQLLGTGHAAYYSPSYDRAWWEKTLPLYESWNVIKPGWVVDPNGYYCVRPGYVPGHRLQLVANGVTITCTIGDMVADPHLSSWLAHWVIEMNYPLFEALGLDRNNSVEV
ncbi:MAG: hypothetical protein M3439_07715, partial [Chloroflexota bacterium]|nr:hypothetical protein [Chloroflexota bacterium]